MHKIAFKLPGQAPVQNSGLSKKNIRIWKLLITLICGAVVIFNLAIRVGDGSVSSALANGTATITISPTPATISGCETIQVQIMVNDVTDLYGADLRLSFDPSVLEVVDDLTDPGINIQPIETFLTDIWVVRNEVDNVAGKIWYAATQLYPSTPKSGSGTLATIHLRAKKSGTSALAFSYTKLAESGGIEILATPMNGSVQVSGPASPTLSITRLNNSDVRISWTAVSGTSAYRLYRAITPASPYFTPSAPAYQTQAGLSYDDLGVLGDVNVQHYYTVTSSCANGLQSEASNRVGEYDYTLRSSASSNYNDIAMVLSMPSITRASSLATYIGGSVRYVSQYKPGTQALQTYIKGISYTDFSLTTGQFVFVVTDNSAPASVSMVGNVPPAGTISFSLVSGSSPKYNFLSLPLDRADLTKASQIVSSMGSGVRYLMAYRIETQSFKTYIPGVSTDFSIAIGEPFAVVLTTGAPSVWH